MLRTILSISGRPGLFRLVNHGKNMLIVESLSTGKRMPAFAHDKVISLGDVSIYAEDDVDVPLAEVMESLKAKADGKVVDVKAIKGDAQLREYFAEVLPSFDRERVYPADIRKVLQWYNLLVEAGITDFKNEMESAAKPETGDE